ncbi:MAG: GIY-YIG nuclease family protein [Candidatus Caldatribacteriota bacterium]|nr:GIY-YIG nuclease family protein [Candidatus Caldatribacteriota bacterium]
MGKIFLKKGDYIYIGSAKGCLEARLRRHLRKNKKTYWHIDYLLKDERTQISQIWVILKSIECEIAEVFYRNLFTETAKKGFGSSDCKCETHLFYIKNKEKMKKVLNEKGFSKRMEFESYDNN